MKILATLLLAPGLLFASTGSVHETEIKSCYVLPALVSGNYDCREREEGWDCKIRYGYKVRKTVLLMVFDDAGKLLTEKEISREVPEFIHVDGTIYASSYAAAKYEVSKRFEAAIFPKSQFACQS